MTQLGHRRTQKKHGFNDYLGAPYVGEYAPLLRIAAKVVLILTGEKSLSPESLLDDLRKSRSTGWNVHMRRPDLWSARLLILIGRRDWDALLGKSKFPAMFENLVEIASYDRLLDSPRGM